VVPEEAMDNLAKQLDAFLAGLMERTDAKTAAALERSAAVQAESGVANKALSVGDRAPDFTLPDQHGRPVSLSGLLKQGPVVLTFYRGGWCPFCSLALRALQRIRPKLARQGAEVVAVSPQPEKHGLSTAERNGLSYPLLADRGNQVAQQYGLVWELTPEERALYERLGHSLPRLNACDSWTLPIPAGYVIAPDGRIIHARVDTRINRRLEPAEVMEALQQLEIQQVQPAS
jgi:peroxiredoxin